MKSRITQQFRQLFGNLPNPIKAQTRAAYRQFKKDANHRSLRFKKVHSNFPIYSVRIGKSYRAVGQLEGDTIVWFWVGSHAEYDQLLSQF